MNIVNKDTRVLTDVTPINYQKTKGSIIFYEMKITGSFSGCIEEMVKWNYYFSWENTKKIYFSRWVEIFDMWGNLFVIEYSDKITRDSDIELLKIHFQAEGKFAKKLENERQVPVFDGYFNYNGKYYTIVDGLNSLTNEVSPEKWVYKWVIISPSKYFQVEKEKKNIFDKIKNIIP